MNAGADFHPVSMLVLLRMFVCDKRRDEATSLTSAVSAVTHFHDRGVQLNWTPPEPEPTRCVSGESNEGWRTVGADRTTAFLACSGSASRRTAAKGECGPGRTRHDGSSTDPIGAP